MLGRGRDGDSEVVFLDITRIISSSPLRAFVATSDLGEHPSPRRFLAGLPFSPAVEERSTAREPRFVI
jgi:hypothetical protein